MNLWMRILLLVAALIASSVTIISVFLLHNLQRTMSKEFEEKWLLLATGFSERAAEGILIEDTPVLDNFLTQFFETKDILYTAIYEETGLLLTQKSVLKKSQLPEFLNEKVHEAETRRLIIDMNGEKNILDIRVPAIFEDEIIGCIQIGLSLAGIDAEIRKRIFNLSLFVIVFILFGFIASFMFARSLTKPIKNLLEGMKIIGGGDLSHTVKIVRSDEIGELAIAINAMSLELQSKTTSINRMVEDLKSSEQELKNHRDNLQDLVKERTAELETTHRKLVESARRVGMAEVATDVLHNVGNVLNSVNVNTAMMDKMIKRSKVSYLSNVVKVLEEHTDDLDTFITTDERGKRLPAFITELSKNLSEENNEMLEAINRQNRHIHHITEIISLQQSYGKISGLSESVNLSEVVEDALQINSEGIKRHDIEIRREYTKLPSMLFDRSKVLQIITNLISNAKYALSKNGQDRKIMRLQIKVPEEDQIKIEITDNGIGIEKDNLNKIFGHGFTTRRDGHGFGLHSSALAAREVGGALTASSEGPGKGSAFTLSLPLKAEDIENAG